MVKQTDPFQEHAYGEHLHNEDEARWAPLESDAPPTGLPIDSIIAILMIVIGAVLLALHYTSA